MKFDFFENKFIETTELGSQPFIVGSDESLNEADVFKIHLKLREALLKLNIPKGHPVCVYGEKEAIFPVVLITLMSMDLPYVPIDLIMPAGRIQKIKEQTNSSVLINCSDKTCEVEFDVVFTKTFEVKSQKDIFSFSQLLNLEDPIRYILFTSGSTGVPKGVQITARALTSFVKWYLNWPLINKECVFMNQAPFSFDISLCDLIGAFANGSKLVLNNYAVLKNGNLFLDRLKKERANTIVCTPSFIQMYLSVPEFNESNYPLLRQIIFIGEELLAVNAKKLKQAFPNLKVVNAYGPTEATVVTTYIEITKEIIEKHYKSLPIGYSCPESEIVVLNKDEETGIGELGIVGPNLSIGYLKDRVKTDEVFFLEKNKIVYRTGDLGYKDNDLVFYLGRNDSQVKLNGYRIELDEISNVILTHPNIENAAVVPLKTKNITKKIICFLLVKDKTTFEFPNEEMKVYLSKYLPAYMIPSEFILREAFPLNSNYKVDKSALLNDFLND